MNILPKKRWHVRTRENIARVRKDEQEAAEEANEKKRRILQADREARAALLRQTAKDKFGIKEEEVVKSDEPRTSQDNGNKHVNFFEDLEEGKVVTTKGNEQAEKEEKQKREEYEKKIGYLTYLGQDTVEATGKIPWYDKVPDRLKFTDSTSQEETSKISKMLHDPLNVFRKFIPSEPEGKQEEKPHSTKPNSESHSKSKKKKKHKKKSKKRKRESSSSDESDSDNGKQAKKTLEQLRTERLRREKQERERTEELLAQLEGRVVKKKTTTVKPAVQQKYNSQFNPDLAKQNFAKEPWMR